MELSNLTSTLRIKLNTIRSTMGETEVIMIMISFSQLDKGFIFNPEIPKLGNSQHRDLDSENAARIPFLFVRTTRQWLDFTS